MGVFKDILPEYICAEKVRRAYMHNARKCVMRGVTLKFTHLLHLCDLCVTVHQGMM